MHNLRLAFRTLAKTPFVTAVAVISLALGIGTNTAIFSLVNQLLLRPLPVREPERLVDFSAPGPKPGQQSCGMAGECDDVFSYAMFRDLEAKQTSFTGIAAHVAFQANLAVAGETRHGRALYVSGSYFPVLGLQAQAGRLFTPDDDRTPGASFLAVLSDGYWRNQLGADPAVVGKVIVVNGQSLTVIGVAPRGFTSTTVGLRPDVYVPLSMREVITSWSKGSFTNRQSYWAYLFARLKPGVTLAQASLATNAIYRPIITDVEAPLQKEMSEQTMAKFKAKSLVMDDGRRGQSSLHTETKTPLTMLFAITGIVLLIACANIANLLLARGAGRSMEMAVRLSLGAGRRQLLAQLLTESLVLALIGGAASLLVARWTLAGIIMILPSDTSGLITVSLEPSIIIFAGALSVLTGFLFGMFPALHSTRPDLVNTIRANAGQLAGARAASRFRTILATAQIALSMTLLISAGLFIKSLANVTRVDLGLKVDDMVTFGLSPSLNGYSHERSRVLFEQVAAQLGAVPGVTAVSVSLVPILAGDNWGQDVSVEGFKRTPDTDANSRFSEVGPNYFHTIGVPLLAGRDFTEADAGASPKVVIVNEAFAKKFNLGRDVVGRHIAMGNTEKLDIEIVGLVRDNKYSDVKLPVPPVFVIPYRQDTSVGSVNFYARTSLPPEQLLRTIPAVIKKLDPNLPVEDLKSMPQQVRENTFLDRMISTLAAAFAALATVLAAIGLYGVLAYSVAQRTREIGVRMALGANGSNVRGMVLRQVGLMIAVGGVAGVAAAIGLGVLAKSLLFGLTGNDPVVMTSAAVLLSVVALGAGYIPALRASRVSPMQALRYEG